MGGGLLTTGNASFHNDSAYTALKPAIASLVALLQDPEEKTRANAAGCVAVCRRAAGDAAQPAPLAATTGIGSSGRQPLTVDRGQCTLALLPDSSYPMRGAAERHRMRLVNGQWRRHCLLRAFGRAWRRRTTAHRPMSICCVPLIPPPDLSWCWPFFFCRTTRALGNLVRNSPLLSPDLVAGRALPALLDTVRRDPKASPRRIALFSLGNFAGYPVRFYCLLCWRGGGHEMGAAAAAAAAEWRA